MRDRMLRWGFPAVLGAIAYAVFLALGLPEWAVFPMILLGAVLGSVIIAVVVGPKVGEPVANRGRRTKK